MKQIITLIICLILIGCQKHITPKKIEAQRIYLQPYDNFTQKEAQELLPVLQKQFSKFLGKQWEFIILNSIPLPSDSYIKERNRYEAIKIIQKQSQQRKHITIGLTHKDICKDIHGYKHYGIVGLSYTPGNSCIVSDKRLSDKNNYWKPILHEFMHAYYGAKHCPNDNPKCFMKDAKGHGTFNIQNKLCHSCDSIVKYHIIKQK